MAEQKLHNRRIDRVIETGLKYATYLFLLYVLTGIKKGGDMRLFIPYITALFLLAHVAVRRDFSALRTAPFYALACYVGISYLLIPFSFAPKISLAGVSREVLPGLFLYAAVHFRSDAEEKVKGLLLLFVAALLLVVGGGYVTYGMRHMKRGIDEHLFPDVPFLKFYLYFNVFAMKVNFLLPFAVAGAAVVRTKAARSILWALIAVSAGAVVLSLSRGGWLSLLVMACLFSLFLSRGRVKLTSAIAALCGILLLISVLVWTTVPAIRQRILVNAEEFLTFHGRTEIWQHYVSAVRESPVTGWGYGDRIIWNNGPAVLTRESGHEVPEQFRIGTHNTVLFVLYHQGIIGLAGYLAFVAAGCVALVKQLSLRLDRHALYVFSLLTALISVFFIHSTIESVPFAMPCIIFGFLSGIQQWDKGRHKSACRP